LIDSPDDDQQGVLRQVLDVSLRSQHSH
jgi:hypothetical protein